MNWQKADLTEERFKDLFEEKVTQLWCSGDIPDIENALAVVGSRQISEYGRRICREFVRVLASVGITIISGLMYGVDIEAHNTAINSGGKTIGVLGFGYESLKNYGYAQNMYEKILSNGAGAVITEYDPAIPAAKWTFPQRNRIIAALSKAVLVIEGAENSGSLITAGHAIEQGKDVFAIPGSIYSSTSKGTNWLIKQGAHIATSPDDILMFFDKVAPGTFNERNNLDSSHKELLNIIEKLGENANSQNIVEALKSPPNVINIELTKLEMMGYISKDIAGQISVLK